MTISSGATSVDLGGAKLDFPGGGRARRQNVKEAANGDISVHDRGYTANIIRMVVRVNDATWASLKTFWTSTAVHKKNSFTLTPDAAVDLDAGLGVAVTVRFWMEILQDNVTSADVHEPTLMFRQV